MKRLRLGTWPGQLLSARPGTATATAAAASSTTRPLQAQRFGGSRHGQLAMPSARRYQSTSTAASTAASTATPTAPSTPTAPETATGTEPAPEDADAESRLSKVEQAIQPFGLVAKKPPRRRPLYSQPSPITRIPTVEPLMWPEINPDEDPGPIPSPSPQQALQSAKLAALHARLGLSGKIPLQTLARTLVDASADPAPLFNNTNLAFLGQTLINYHTAELLMCRYPRLPMAILHAAMKAYAGDKSLYRVARSWGIECAAAPGCEVDPGLLQFALDKPRPFNTKWGFARPVRQVSTKSGRGTSSSVIMDDDFGEAIPRIIQRNKDGGRDADGSEAQRTEEEADEDDEASGLPVERQLSLGDPTEKHAKSESIHATFARAVVGAIYTHVGRDAARSFVQAHVLSRQLDLAKLFTFKLPVRELARLCMREEFEPPVARLLSETGRLSRTPVFVVGIFSGRDKLGEGQGPSLEMARKKAAMNALMAWYLYSPGHDVRVPSDMWGKDAKPWTPVHVDIGEVITSGV